VGECVRNEGDSTDDPWESAPPKQAFLRLVSQMNEPVNYLGLANPITSQICQ